nr:MAG TPA: hypothetical protein [Caudoviricetes sp.]
MQNKKARHKAGAVREIYRNNAKYSEIMISLIVEIGKYKKEL